jgi:hypothetical protein
MIRQQQFEFILNSTAGIGQRTATGLPAEGITAVVVLVPEPGVRVGQRRKLKGRRSTIPASNEDAVCFGTPVPL